MSNNFFTPPSDIEALTLARSSDINNLSDAVDTAFDKVPEEAYLKLGTVNYAGTDTGAVNAHVVSLPYAPSSYTDGLLVVFKPANTNTSTTVTINVNSLGVKSIKLKSGDDPAVGDVLVNVPLAARYSTSTGFFHINGNASVSAANAAASAASTSASAASASAAAAAASAAILASSGISSTSTTSLTIGTGTKNLTTQTGILYAAGMYLVIADTSAPTTNSMSGQITSYDTGTGALVVNVLSKRGSGTISDWTIGLTGAPGSATSRAFFLAGG